MEPLAVHRHPHVCPWCHTELASSFNLTSEAAPYPGAATLCLACDKPSVFEEQQTAFSADPVLALRRPTREEYQAIMYSMFDRLREMLPTVDNDAHPLDMNCPWCAAKADGDFLLIGEGESGPPKAGDATICQRCKNPSVFIDTENGLSLRRTTTVTEYVEIRRVYTADLDRMREELAAME